MERVDQRLAAEGVAIPHRQMKAVMLVGNEYGLALPFGPPLPGVQHPAFQHWWVTQRIYEWFRRRYGESTKTDFSVGRTVLMLRDDKWVMQIPRAYGRVQFEVSRTPNNAARQAAQMGINPLRYNVLDGIENLPDGLRKTLTDDELASTMDHFMLAFHALTGIEALTDVPLVAAAQSDIAACVHHITAPHEDFMNAKWSALHATEKLIKAAMESAELGFDYTHALKKLASAARAGGLKIEIDDLVDSLRCTPSIRYHEETASLQEAIAAHRASLEAATRIVPLIDSKRRRV